MKNIYINLNTGEVVVRKNIRQATRYFKKDAKAYGYQHDRDMVISYSAYESARGRA